MPQTPWGINWGTLRKILTCFTVFFLNHANFTSYEVSLSYNCCSKNPSGYDLLNVWWAYFMIQWVEMQKKKNSKQGPFYQKGVVPRFKKGKCVTFRAHWKLNLSSTPKILGSK